MNHRREFLVDLFRALGESGVRYCMLRNYEDLCDNASDVDLLVESRDLTRL